MRLKIDGQNRPFSSTPKGATDGACHEMGPSTTFNPMPQTMPAFHEKSQAFYLRFSFRVTCRGRGLPPKRSRWAYFVADGSRGSPRKAKTIRFPLSTGDQGLLRIWCHFKTMPDYGAKVGALIHTPYF